MGIGYVPKLQVAANPEIYPRSSRPFSFRSPYAEALVSYSAASLALAAL
jgi:hypothetical protein